MTAHVPTSVAGAGLFSDMDFKNGDQPAPLD
jgi:hypothetical protein